MRIKPQPRIIHFVDGKQADIVMLAPSPSPKALRMQQVINEVMAPVALPGRVTIAQVMLVVAREFDVHIKDLVARDRRRRAVFPRHVAMYLAHAVTGRSLPDVGRRFGGFDHTTVLHARNSVKNRMAEDAMLATKIGALKQELLAHAGAS